MFIYHYMLEAYFKAIGGVSFKIDEQSIIKVF